MSNKNLMLHVMTAYVNSINIYNYTNNTVKKTNVN